VGACGLAPVVTVGEKVFGRVAPSQVKEIIAEYRDAASDDAKIA
jgi:NADH-quinone oxidoreductase subunit E/NADP-reducing hydrogenase subunit HndA